MNMFTSAALGANWTVHFSAAPQFFCPAVYFNKKYPWITLARASPTIDLQPKSPHQLHHSHQLIPPLQAHSPLH